MADEKKTQEETKTEEAKEEKVSNASPKVEKLVEEISTLSVLELSELVKVLQDKLGVSAMPIAQASPAAGNGEADAAGASAGGGAATQTVVLANAGSNKIAVIKALREINNQLGLKEAKDLAESAPKEILIDVKAAEAAEAKKKLEEAGASVELK